jgi:hypothetical protein
MNIEILDVDRATRAAQWCKRHRIDYKLEFRGWPGHTRYRFVFTDSQDLVNFTLKWA